MAELMTKDEIEDRRREGGWLHVLAELGLFDYPEKGIDAALFYMAEKQ